MRNKSRRSDPDTVRGAGDWSGDGKMTVKQGEKDGLEF